jgi:N-acetylmuramoyl-L-alanine amidase
MALVVLDPGHGGSKPVGRSSDNNAVGPAGTLEKTINLQIAELTRAILAAGHEVRMTRATDTNLGLVERARVARDITADVFVSIHFNASDEHNAQGTETLLHSSHYTQHSVRLASCVQNTVVAALEYRDRKTKRKNLGVVNGNNHHSSTAAVLIESSFMDIADEEARLNTIVHRQKIARAIADGVQVYLSDPHAWGATRYDNPEVVASQTKGWLRILWWRSTDQDA